MRRNASPPRERRQESPTRGEAKPRLLGRRSVISDYLRTLLVPEKAGWILVGLLPWLALMNARAQSSTCEPPFVPHFTVNLPRLNLPPDEEGQGWDRPPVWEHHPDATADSITVPNGRPIYALILSGYGRNRNLDEFTTYNFARHLMGQGAYVHFAWWNNLLAPYMERPLHHSQSNPGSANFWDLATQFTTAEQAGKKAVPAEDYQFVADAKRFLDAIRENNPSALIVLVGHSMGGGAVVHLADRADVVIDLLAPIDAVNNRNYPWSRVLNQVGTVPPDYNWNRWRVTRDNFRGYQSSARVEGSCVPTGPWLKDEREINNALLCLGWVYYDSAPPLRFGSHVINLHYRWQNESYFPYDYEENYTFNHTRPPGGTTSQVAVATKSENSESDPGGWPRFSLGSKDNACSVDRSDGVGWGDDGHGEIVGFRGPARLGSPLGPVPLGLLARTSAYIGDCSNGGSPWPLREESGGVWVNGDGMLRKDLLQVLESFPANAGWIHAPLEPDLCLVSQGLINKFEAMNKPPTADAGGDQVVECSGMGLGQVTLDGSASVDPDGDALGHEWRIWIYGDRGSDPVIAVGEVVTIDLPLGFHCIELWVGDSSGHQARDYMTVDVVDTTPPVLTVKLSPQVLWPPNHKMVDIQATLEAVDACGEVASLTLVSIVSNQPDNDKGDGNTTGDIVADFGTRDELFQLRAERAAKQHDRVYTVTYQATDDSGNQAVVSEEVRVPRRYRKPPKTKVKRRR